MFHYQKSLVLKCQLPTFCPTQLETKLNDPGREHSLLISQLIVTHTHTHSQYLQHSEAILHQQLPHQNHLIIIIINIH